MTDAPTRCALVVAILAVLAISSASACGGDQPPPAPLHSFERLQIRMGIPVTIKVYAADELIANAALDAAYARLKELDRTLSDYDPDSELNQLARMSAPGRPVRVSDDLWTVLEASLEVAEQTDGAFDITVGPLTELWRKVRRRRAFPPREELEEARSLVGYEHIKLHEETQSVELLIPDMQLDVGGIAKGYAADEALEVMRTHGVTRAMIDAGGDIVAGDPPSGRDNWTIGVAPLLKPKEKPVQFLALENAAVATSGDAFQYVELEGVRYSHLVDPKTGLGLTLRSSVSVYAPSGMQADALASAFSVLGPEAAVGMANRLDGVETLIVTQCEAADGQSRLRTYRSNGWEALARAGVTR